MRHTTDRAVHIVSVVTSAVGCFMVFLPVVVTSFDSLWFVMLGVMLVASSWLTGE